MMSNVSDTLSAYCQFQMTLSHSDNMEAFGSACAKLLNLTQVHASPYVIYLQGDLGAGKTTWTRGFLRYLGHEGAVKSPTYTLVEPYHFSQCQVYHFDLYRLSDPEELDFLGIEDYFDDQSGVIIVEWPQCAQGRLPNPDLLLQLSYIDSGRKVDIQGFSHKICAGLADLV